MKSIFEGWTKQGTEGTGNEKRGYCAYGYLTKDNLDASWCSLPVDVQHSCERIGRWIQKNMNPPSKWISPMGTRWFPDSGFLAAIFWANDAGLLDIEGFKMVDLLTQGFVPEEVAELEKVQS